MRPSTRTAAVAALAVGAQAASLADVCTTSKVIDALPANGTLLGINLLPSTVSANAVYNASAGGSMGGGSSSSTTYSYCNVSVAYTHPGKGDEILLEYALPAPSEFKNRFYVSGGGGFSLSSSTTGGLAYGAASGASDAGYGVLSGTSYDSVVLYGNGSINWDATYMFAYQALGEMTTVGKALVSNFYGNSSAKIYTYFEGCSDGGREGMSQVQRYGELYDGVVAGAPAFRFAQQQVHHVFSSAVEKTMDYYPPPCELSTIVNLTISACDPLDGRTDGVISRTDLCQLNFNLSSLVGQSYYCAAENSTSLGFGFSKRAAAEGSTTSYQPAQNGTITTQGVAVAQAIYDGLHNLAGERAYLSWQIGSELSDAEPTYDSSTGSWTLNIPSTGGEYVTKFVQLLDLDNLSDLNNVTYDTLVDWMTIGMYRYLDSLQTTLPDLTAFQSHGGKLLHYHGESDPSIPAASSVHYWQSVLATMYSATDAAVHDAAALANATLNATAARAAMADWYQFYLVPGAAHCGTNSLQPGPYPQSNVEIMIDWVENGVTPSRLNATVSSGDYAGETQMLCQWPTRPLWSSNDTSTFECVEDEASVRAWTYDFPAFKVPVF